MHYFIYVKCKLYYLLFRGHSLTIVPTHFLSDYLSDILKAHKLIMLNNPHTVFLPLSNISRQDTLLTLWKWTGRILWLSSWKVTLISLSIIITDSCQDISHGKVWLTHIWWGWWTITNQQPIRQILTHKRRVFWWRRCEKDSQKTWAS